MPRNGAGTYTPYTPGNPVVTGTVISSTTQNNTINDIATALSGSIAADGQTTTTVAIPFAQGLSSAALVDISAVGAGQIKFPATQNPSANANTLDDYEESTFTPTVTLVGGAGNTVPVYTTNSGRSTKIGNRYYVDIFLTGDGGAEGAGTGQLTIALPAAAHASFPGGLLTAGSLSNNTSVFVAYISIVGGASVLQLTIQDSIGTTLAVTGVQQNNTLRSIRLQFQYEAA